MRTTCLLAALLAAAPAIAAPPTAGRGLVGVVHADLAKGLPAAARAALARDGSVVVGGHEEHFFSLYDRNAYERVPSFITVDVLLHVFHARFDRLLGQAERSVGQEALASLARRQLGRAMALWPREGAPPERLRRLALYHAVPLALLGGKKEIDPRLAEAVRAEVARVEARRGVDTPPQCGRPVDYSRFQPRGHYSSWNLREYFLASTWYSECALDLDDADGLARAADVVRLVDGESRRDLDRVLALRALVAGPADDPGVAELGALLDGAPALPAAVDAARLRPRMAAVAAGRVLTQASVGEGGRRLFRLLGGAATPDAVLFSRTTSAARPLPSGLDVVAALGSGDARRLLADEISRHPELGRALDAPFVAEKRSLYERWLAVLAEVVRAPGPGQPAFARTPAWERHLTVAAAGSWAELRHDTLLMVKQGITFMEGGHDAELPATRAGGYVEPRPEVFRLLSSLLADLDRLLGARAGEGEGDALRDLLSFLTDVAERELDGRPIPPAADRRLREIGQELERLARGHADRLPDQAVIADVHTALDGGGARALHVATGRVDEIWVVVPRGKQRLLTRGGAFSYHELVGEPGERLDDRGWAERLDAGRAPRPEWARPVATRPAPRARARTRD